MNSKEPSVLFQPYLVWVLAPHLESEDPNIQYYYDFTQSIREYTAVFETLKADWKWQPVTMQNFKEIIRDISRQSSFCEAADAAEHFTP